MLLLLALLADPAAATSAGTTTEPILAPGRWEPTIAAALEEMIRAHGTGSPGYDPARPPVATFDWDNTSIRGDIGDAMLARMDGRDGGDRVARFEAMCEEQGKAACYSWAATSLAGTDEIQLRLQALDTIDWAIATQAIAIRPEMRDLYAALQRHGWDVWVVSASAEPVVEAFAQSYGVPADHVIGLGLARDADGRYLPAIDGPITWRQGKVDAIRERIGALPTFAAGDTDTDLEMLAAARYALVMDRGNPATTQAARKAGWWLQPPGW